MGRTFFISDTHFGDNDKGIISFERRPFKDKDDMINKLIENWNSEVRPGDAVWHLGDVFWGLEREEREDILKRLNGTKMLVMGNHDRNGDIDYWLKLGFDKVYDLPVVFNDFFILSHEPLYMTSGPYVNIFGHVHGNKAYKDYSETSFCVCVERKPMRYKPIDFENIKKYIYSTLN